MSSSSNSNPRRPRSNSSVPPRNTPRASSNRSKPSSPRDDREFDIREPRRSAPAKKSTPQSKAETDAGVRRRQLKKKKNRQSAFLAWTIAAAATVMIFGMGAGVLSEYHKAEGRVGQKRATLADLRTQLEIGKKRLNALKSASGKERVLVENGFVKPGERLLLFPKGKKDSSSDQ